MQGGGDGGFAADDAGPDGAQRRPEGGAYELRDGGTQGDQHALADESELDEAVAGGQLPSDGIVVWGSFALEALVVDLAPDGYHVGHPEVVEKGAEGAQGTLVKSPGKQDGRAEARVYHAETG